MKDLTSRLDQVNVLPQENRGNSSYSNFYSNAKKVVSNFGRAVGKAIAPVLVSSALAIGLGVQETKAAPVSWSSFSDIVGPIPEGYSQTYTSTTSSSLPNQVSGILYWTHPSLGNVAIGGFDLVGGNVALSYFGDVGEAYSANTGEGANPNYFWLVFEDKDNNHSLGTREGNVLYDLSEQLDPSTYSISNFMPYGSAIPGNFTYTQVPEASTFSLFALGAAVIELCRRRQSRK